MSKLNELLTQSCPCGIKYSPLSKVCKSLPKGTLKTGDLNQNGKYPVINSGKDFYGRYQEYNNEGNVFTLAARGEYAGFVTYIEHRFWAGGLCYPYRSKSEDELLTKFVYYFLKQQENTIMSTLVARGSIPALNKADIDKIMIPLPPLPVQQEIVRILDSFMELTAELTAELAARRKQYEHYRDELLTFGEDVPKLPISQIANFKYGYTDKAQDSGDTRFIRITDITDDGCLTPFDAKYINLTEESKKYLLAKGDLLLARTGASYGKTLYYPDYNQAVYASFLIKIEPNNDKILNRFYWHFSKSSLYWAQAEKLVSKGGQQQFNTGAIGRVVIPVPSLDAQRRIVSILDRFDTLCNDLTSGLPAEIAARQKQYEYYRDKLLTFKELEG